MTVRTMTVVCALFLLMCSITSGRELEISQAVCKIGWLLGLRCEQVNSALVTQIRAMDSYRLGPVTPNLIQAKHTSAVGQTESVNFNIKPAFMDQGCHMEGSSTSAFWYSLFGNDTNYCNLHNVIKGSGLTRAPGFTEFTNAWFCLGYGKSSCE